MGHVKACLSYSDVGRVIKWEAVRQAAGITHTDWISHPVEAGWLVRPIGRDAHIPPTSPGAKAARALPVSGRLRPRLVT